MFTLIQCLFVGNTNRFPSGAAKQPFTNFLCKSSKMIHQETMPESCPKGSSQVIAKKTKEFISPAEEVYDQTRLLFLHCCNELSFTEDAVNRN